MFPDKVLRHANASPPSITVGKKENVCLIEVTHLHSLMKKTQLLVETLNLLTSGTETNEMRFIMSETVESGASVARVVEDERSNTWMSFSLRLSLISGRSSSSF